MTARRHQCPKCGSKDNLIVWDDSHGKCFTPGCDYRIGAKSTSYIPQYKSLPLPTGIPPRGLSAETCSIYQVTYFMGLDGKPVVCYPYFDKRMNHVMTKFRTRGWTDNDGDRRVWTDVANVTHYFGSHVRSSKKTHFLCEGESDVMATAQALRYGYTVLGAPGANTLARCHNADPELLNDAGNIIVVKQSDAAGEYLLTEASNIVQPHRILSVKLDLKDAASYTQQKREQELLKALYAAERIAPDVLMDGEALVNEVSEYLGLTAGKGIGLTTGFIGLDLLISGWRPNSITLLAAQTKNGKSTLVTQLAYTFAAMHGNVLFLSLEMSVAETVLTFVQVHRDCRIMGEDIPYNLDSDRQFIQQLGQRVKILKHTGFLSPSELENIVRRGVEEFGCKLLVVDHLTIAATSIETGHDNKHIDALCMKLKSLVNQYNLACIAAVQVNEVRNEWVTEHDVKGSATQKQMASSVIAIKRYHQTRQSCIYSLVADRFSGRSGRVVLDFGNGRFTAQSSMEIH